MITKKKKGKKRSGRDGTGMRTNLSRYLTSIP